MLVREKVIEVVRDLPASFSVEDLLNRVILLEKIERGLSQSKSGQVKTLEQAKEYLGKWV